MKRKINMSSLLANDLKNSYKGHKASKYLFYIITIVTILRSLVHVFAKDGGAKSIATIPLESYSVEAANTVVLIFALWGLSQLLMGIFYGLVALKYQVLIPLMYLLMTLEYIMRLIIGQLKPIETESTPPGALGNYIMIPILILLLCLSLYEKKEGENERP